jgi:hypothetical protein
MYLVDAAFEAAWIVAWILAGDPDAAPVTAHINRNGEERR